VLKVFWKRGGQGTRPTRYDTLSDGIESCRLRRLWAGELFGASAKESKVAATLRFLQFLSLGCWVGSIIFFILMTTGIFSVIPNKDLAGVVVGYSLARLHILGIVAGCVYLLVTAVLEKSVAALARPAALLVFLMILCTMASQYGVIARMDALRAQMGSVDSTPAENPLRVEFERLHQYSVRLEIAVLFSGFAALFLTARQRAS
jgi:hypothetical protein